MIFGILSFYLDMHFIWKLGNICRSDFQNLIEFSAKQIFEGKILKSDPRFMAIC